MVVCNYHQGQEQHMFPQQEEQQVATQQQQDLQAGLQHLALQQQTASATPVRLVHQQQQGLVMALVQPQQQ